MTTPTRGVLSQRTHEKDKLLDANGRLEDGDIASADFLQFIQSSKYSQCTRLEKPVELFELVETWKRQGGRFLERVGGSCKELGDKKAREYLGRILRRMNSPASSSSVDKSRKLPKRPSLANPERRISTQLDYAQDGILYGRSAEQKILQEALRLAAEKAQMVIISGSSGVGKTALAHSVQRPNILFAQGKFEQPFHVPVVETSLNAALVDAMTDLVYQIPLTAQHREALQDMVDSSVLRSVFPAIADLLYPWETSNDSIHAAKEGAQGKRGGKMKVLVVSSLLKMISSEEQKTMVLQIDDLQWADEASLDVLTDLLSLIADVPRILLLFTDREDTYDIGLDLKKKRLFNFPETQVHRIALTPLSEASVTSLLGGLLKVDEAEVADLAQFFYTKTCGNVAFICELLRRCQDEDALIFDESSRQWCCDETFVTLVISDCIDMSDLLSVKIRALPKAEQQLLQTASCIGSTFDDTILRIVVQFEGPLEAALVKAVSQRLVLFDDHRSMYRFAHDSIQKTIYCLAEESERESMHLSLGKKIFGFLEKEGTTKSERLIDIGLSQLIRGSKQLEHHHDRVDVAKLCLEVGERAFAVQGFHSSSTFLQHAISLLGDRKWQTDYDLCLRLHNTAAEVAYCTGWQATVQSLVDEILSNTRCFEDSLAARATKVYALGSVGETQKAIEYGINTLEELGVKIPIHPTLFDIMRSNWKIRRVRKIADADVLCLPLMRDNRQIAAMQFMNLLMFNAWKFNSKLMGMIIQEMVILTLEGGLTSASAPAFGWFGALLCLGGDDIESEEGANH